MNIIVKSILLSILCIGVSQAKVIWPAATDVEMTNKTGTLTEGHAKNALQILEKMPWIEEGAQKGQGKYLYVFFNPASSTSKDLYTKTRPYLNYVNIRWIPIRTDETNVNGLYETRTPQALADAFNKGVMPKIRNQKQMNAVENMTFTGFIMLRGGRMLSPEGESYFPTMIYGDSDKLSVVSASNYIEGMMNNIPLTMPNITQPTIVELAERQPVTLHRFKEDTRYQTQEGERAPMLLYPSEDAVRTGSLGSDNPPVIIDGMTDNGYLAIDFNGMGNFIYIKDDPSIIRLSK